MSNYLNDSFAALRMVQRTVNNVTVVRLQYNHCIVSVIWSELSSDNIMVSTVSTAASISSTPITSPITYGPATAETWRMCCLHRHHIPPCRIFAACIKLYMHA